ncbi:hypothetical protein L7F22_018402 [Adiantum nelumboides]|nr:hypothetical protein [Adiantum nelumboides]
MKSFRCELLPLDVSEEECTCLEPVLSDYHTHEVLQNQCSSLVSQRIHAPLSLVWSLVRRFDNPQRYKHFIRSCEMQEGDGSNVGSIREVSVVSGLPASCSRERLERLDEEKHVLSFSVVGGEHRLRNYRSTTSLHELAGLPCGGGLAGGELEGHSSSTLVVESFVVDVPDGNSRDETLTFVDTVVKCNLQSLATISERLAPPCATCTATSAS